ncbi:hypothetical protein A6R70_23165 [Agrobacterium rubi]|nr:hypothetical protein [Agrobacterium rubi]
MALHASIAIGGIDVTAGKPDENGEIVVTGENAAITMTDLNGVGDMNIVTTDGSAWILAHINR